MIYTAVHYSHLHFPVDNENYRFKARCELNYSLGISFESWLTLCTIVPHGIIYAKTLPSYYVTQTLLWVTVTIAVTRFTPFRGGRVAKCSRNADPTVRTLSMIYDKNQVNSLTY